MSESFIPMVTNRDFSTPNNTISLDPVLHVHPSLTITRQSGGTAHILDAFRSKASFDIKAMVTFLDGGKKKSIKRQWIVGASDKTCAASRHHGSRPQLLRDHLSHFLAVHGDYLTSYVPTREEVGWMQEYAMMSGTMMNHYGLFVSFFHSHHQMLHSFLAAVTSHPHMDLSFDPLPTVADDLDAGLRRPESILVTGVHVAGYRRMLRTD